MRPSATFPTAWTVQSGAASEPILNYYQTVRKNIEKSRGGSNKAIAPNETILWNHDLTDRALPDPDASKPPSKPDHYSIQAQLNNLIMKIFLQALTVKQVTDFWEP